MATMHCELVIYQGMQRKQYTTRLGFVIRFSTMFFQSLLRGSICHHRTRVIGYIRGCYLVFWPVLSLCFFLHARSVYSSTNIILSRNYVIAFSLISRSNTTTSQSIVSYALLPRPRFGCIPCHYSPSSTEPRYLKIRQQDIIFCMLNS